MFDSPAGENLLFVTTTPVHLDPLAIRASIEQLVALEPRFIYLTDYGPVQPTAANVRQLLESLDAFVAIAEQHASPLEGRHQRIAEAMLDWLTTQLATINPAADLQQARAWLATDADLNTQGWKSGWTNPSHSESIKVPKKLLSG